MPPFCWEDIDHRLVALKLQDLSGEMTEKIQRSEAQIRFENRSNANSGAALHKILEMKEKTADEWAERTYRIYCEVWEKQGKVKSADFIRAVWLQAVSHGLAAREAAMVGELRLLGIRTGLGAEHVKGIETGFRLRMARLSGRWKRRIEIEARDLDHADAKTARLGSPDRDAQQVPPSSASSPANEDGASKRTNLAVASWKSNVGLEKQRVLTREQSSVDKSTPETWEALYREFSTLTEQELSEDPET